MYPFNWPFAGAIHSLGIPLFIKIVVFHDKEANVYFASSPTIRGLNVEGDSLDEVKREVELTLPGLIQLNNKMTKKEINKRNAKIQFETPLYA